MSAPMTPHAAPNDIITMVEIPGVGITFAAGATTPSNSVAGYAKGGVFINTATGVWVRNSGTLASATWVTMFSAAPATALTAVASDTVDDTYGSEEQGVIGNNRTRIGEIEAALIAVGILAAP